MNVMRRSLRILWNDWVRIEALKERMEIEETVIRDVEKNNWYEMDRSIVWPKEDSQEW